MAPYDDVVNGMLPGISETLNVKHRQESEIYDSIYVRGLNDAWECARTITDEDELSEDALAEIFGEGKTLADILNENSASDAMDKIRAYGDMLSKAEVGDEVTDGRTFEVICAVYGNGQYDSVTEYGTVSKGRRLNDVTKTGRRFPQIVQMLRLMKRKHD